MSLKGVKDIFLSKNCIGQLRYDRLGRLCLSQNGIQKPYLYSYTKYDALSRIIEVGQLNTVSTKVAPGTFVKVDATLQNFIRHWHHGQVTHTFYDTVQYSSIPITQTNLRKRVASITFEDVDDSNVSTYDNAIHYSYDIEGNVATLLNDNTHNTIVKQRYKRIDYYYDLQSGKVNELIYQHDSADQFMQIYEYDADNRITDVLTSRDSAYFEHDAGYEYYDHGPLAREVLGQRQVQGVDYAYTLNGWIKGINSSILNPSYDMGLDGNVHNAATASIGRDAVGLTLEYFTGDYRAIGTSKFEAYGLPDTGLYNGNIAGVTYSIKPLNPKTIGYKYTYDQLDRLNDMVAFTAIDTVNDKWNSPSSILDFQEKVVYDENGNIFKYLRHGNTIGTGTSLAMDSLNYHYKKGKNQLTNVRDGVPAANYPNDIDDEPSPRNYQYNTIGELAKDSAGQLDTIIWTVYGKIKKITMPDKANSSAIDSLVFEYDGLGNRIEKRHYWEILNVALGAYVHLADTTLYDRDVQGNILSIRDRNKDTVRMSEWDLYGAKRIGSLDTAMRLYPKVPVNIGGTIDSTTVAYLENQKQYELDNHLGNVLVTISDRKLWIDTTGTPNIANYYVPNIVSANDYYPFGMLEPGRSYQLASDSSYRFAFNGKEKLNEAYGPGNAYDYGMRMYDPRVGRFMSTDPLFKKYPGLTPYQFASLNPIANIDLDGLEGTGSTGSSTPTNTPNPPPQPPLNSWGPGSSDNTEKVKIPELPKPEPQQTDKTKSSSPQPNPQLKKTETEIKKADEGIQRQEKKIVDAKETKKAEMTYMQPDAGDPHQGIDFARTISLLKEDKKIGQARDSIDYFSHKKDSLKKVEQKQIVNQAKDLLNK
jgi:RHS repeat-associated protein